MALETLKNLKSVNGEEIVVMDDLRTKYPEKFTPSGSMDWKWFETTIRPTKFIYVRHDKNSLSFTIQNGPLKEAGKNGCQVIDILAVCKHMFEEFQKTHPCRENAMTITKLDEALMWQEKRTRDRIQRNVEGTSQK